MEQSSNKKNLVNTIAIFVIGVALIIGLFLLASKGKEEVKQEGEEEIKQKAELLAKLEGNFIGSKDAEIVIVEFSDFQCPACAIQGPIIKDVVREYPEDVKLVFKHFPLTSIHPNSPLAAEATESAAEEDKFFQMHDKLFENQKEWSTLDPNSMIERFVDYAKEIGIEDVDKFKYALQNGVYTDKVQQDLNLALELGLNSTPTVFFNGEILQDRSRENIIQKIEAIKTTD